jgi:hypothetical protein
MPINVDVELLQYMRNSSGAIHIEIRGCSRPAAAVAGLHDAGTQIFRVPHPNQPDSPFASFASSVTQGSTGVGFWFDMADAEAYPDVLECALELILIALDDAGVEDGDVTWPSGTASSTYQWARSPHERWVHVLDLFTDDPPADTSRPVASNLIELGGGWRRHAPIPTKRERIAATTGADGRIYAIGGARGGPVRTVEAYDITTDSWSRAAPLGLARRRPGVASGPDGRVYAVGGYGPPLDNGTTAEAYDISTNRWSAIRPMNDLALNEMAATAGPDGLIYAISSDPNVFEAYDTATDRWTTLPPLPDPGRGLMSLATTPDGQLYLVGSSVWAFNPLSGQWKAQTDFNVPRWGHSAALGRDGRIYLMGGTDGLGTTRPHSAVAAVEAFDGAQGQWSTVADMPTPRNIPTVAIGPDGSVFAIGGSIEVMLPRTPMTELMGYQATSAETVDTVESYLPRSE